MDDGAECAFFKFAKERKEAYTPNGFAAIHRELDRLEKEYDRNIMKLDGYKDLYNSSYQYVLENTRHPQEVSQSHQLSPKATPASPTPWFPPHPRPYSPGKGTAGRR